MTEDQRPTSQPATRTQRPFLFGRLADTVRRQDWFTVLVEVAIVVLGVVIGFQVTAWGQARADRVKEQVYLNQLATDLRETILLIGKADTFAARRDTATTQILRAAYGPPPPRSELMAWLRDADRVTSVEPVAGTVEALVATGDLNLIRDVALRSDLTSYLRDVRAHLALQQDQMAQWHRSNKVMLEGLDPAEQFLSGLTPAASDSLTRDPLSPYPSLRERTPYRFDHETYLSDPIVHRALFEMYINQQNLRTSWNRLLRSSEDLLSLVEAGIKS